jgi:nitrilase
MVEEGKDIKMIKVAVAQSAPVLFDRDASVEKAVRLVSEAGRADARLVLLPEAYIPAYPRGFSFGMVVGNRTPEGRSLWKRYWDNAVEVPGKATEALGAAAREAGVYLAIGVIERDTEFSRGTLYCTLLYFNPQGNLMGKHRKLKPTGSERLIWGEGDGSTLPVFETEIGRIGGLICWENHMPLARVAMYSKGVEIYLAPTADQRDIWQAALRHIAFEGRCFVLGCNQFVTKDMYPAELESIDELKDQPEIMCRGGSVVVSPTGDVLAGPLYDKEDILYVDLDMDEIVKAQLDLDVVGHYGRPDVFQLYVNEQPLKPVTRTDQFGQCLNPVLRGTQDDQS